MSEATNLFTYPEGWNEMLAALDFLPEEMRDPFLRQMLEFLGFGLVG